MLPRNRWFVAAALLYALLGGLLGVAWLGWPGRLPGLALRAHAHLMLVGFVGMMISGIALHVLPRFIGAPIRGGWMAWAQQSLLHAGLVLMVLPAIAGARSLSLPGGVLALAGLAAFAVRLWPVLTWDGRG